jgi:C4-type Zn-finger protein
MSYDVKHALSSCPHCHKDQRKNTRLDGIPQFTYQIMADAAVVKCEFCKKDFFSEGMIGSHNYKIEDDDGKPDLIKIEQLKKDFGYSNN